MIIVKLMAYNYYLSNPLFFRNVSAESEKASSVANISLFGNVVFSMKLKKCVVSLIKDSCFSVVKASRQNSKYVP